MFLLPLIGNRRSLGLKVLICCSLLTGPICLTAQNLVPNPSFELHDQCPSSYGFVENSRPQFWRSWRSSPDYFHSCAGAPPETSVSVPYNGVAFQYAMEGEAYAGFVGYSEFDEYREYVGVTLLEPMVVGRRYDVSLEVNLAADGQFEITTAGCNNIGVLFTRADENSFASGPIVFRNYAHVHSTDVLLDTAGWVTIQGSFVADSAYDHMVIGNFFENELTLHQPLLVNSQEVAYVLIDAVRVTDELTTSIGESLNTSLSCTATHFDGTVHIQWPGQTAFQVQVFDLRGRALWNGDSMMAEMILPSSEWPKGMYLARLHGPRDSVCLKFNLD